jgi:itaconate CoA-transferase
MSGYGTTGPYRDKKAYDLLVQSEAGLLSVTGTPETPSKVGISIADIAAGMYAFSGILAALLQRERTGEGAAVEVSMFDALGEWMGFPAYYGMYTGVPPARTGARHAAIAPYGPFRAGDGQVVYLGIQNEREWMRFCEVVLGRPELAADSRFGSNALRVEHQYALEAIIIAVFAERTGEQVVAALDGAGIANARMNTMAEFLDHPQLRERNRWRDIASPAGPLRALLPPFDIEGVEPAMGSVPSLGEHTDAILRELGFEPAVIARWRQERVI